MLKKTDIKTEILRIFIYKKNLILEKLIYFPWNLLDGILQVFHFIILFIFLSKNTEGAN